MKKVTILLFHNIRAKNSDHIFKYLTNKYNIIKLSKFIKAIENCNEKILPPKALIITFDDGHKGNYYLLPILKKYNIPITIFLCSEIIGTNRHFWFRSKNPKIHQNLKNISNSKRLSNLREFGFEQTKEFSSRQALSYDEIDEMKGVVDFQSHTMFHPCLPQCTYSKAKEEIFKSKDKLENELGLNITTISYPNGDYSNRDIQLCKMAGYKCGITVDYGFNTINTPPFRLKRLSVNDTENLDELIVKSSGVWMGLLKVLKKIPIMGSQKIQLIKYIL